MGRKDHKMFEHRLKKIRENRSWANMRPDERVASRNEDMRLCEYLRKKRILKNVAPIRKQHGWQKSPRRH